MELCDCGAAPNGFTINTFDEKDCICEKCAKDQNLKKCTRCPLWQKRDQFRWYNKSKGKRTSHCAECEKKRIAKYRKSAKGKVSRAKYNKSAKGKASAANYGKSAKGKASMAKYKKSAKGKAASKRAKKKLYSTPEGKLLRDTRRLLRDFYHGTLGPTRLARVKKLVGCSRRVYRYAIFSQWKPGMCRDNKGTGKDKWNIDHRVPFAAFKGRLEANLPMICWYGNVQPLWHVENSSKGKHTKDEEIQSLHMRYQAWLSTVH